VFATIDAYLDESGIHGNAKVCMIAGYWGGPGQMRRLDRAWRDALAKFGFPMKDFHAKDLIKKRDARSMLEALARVAGEQRKVYPVAYGIVVDDFNSFSLDERRFMTGATLMQKSAKLVTSGCPSKPYFAPFQNILKIVTDAAPVGGKAHFYFGLGRSFAEYARVMFKQIKEDEPIKKAVSTWRSRDRLGDARFPLAEETAPLQAADLLVHSLYIHMQERIAKGESGDFTKSPTGLARLCVANAFSGSDLVYQNKECLQKMIDQAKSLCPTWIVA
jgi:hypothetical protein